MRTGFSTLFIILIVLIFLFAAYLIATSKKSPLLTSQSESVTGSIETTKDCGQTPQTVQDFIAKSQQVKTMLPIQKGPDWSSDCRYIAITVQAGNRNAHLHLYRAQNNKIEEIKTPKGSSEYSGINHTKWFPNGCLETEVSVDGVSGLTKIYYNPGQGFSSSSSC